MASVRAIDPDPDKLADGLLAPLRAAILQALATGRSIAMRSEPILDEVARAKWERTGERFIVEILPPA